MFRALYYSNVRSGCYTWSVIHHSQMCSDPAQPCVTLHWQIPCFYALFLFFIYLFRRCNPSIPTTFWCVLQFIHHSDFLCKFHHSDLSWKFANESQFCQYHFVCRQLCQLCWRKCNIRTSEDKEIRNMILMKINCDVIITWYTFCI